MPTLSDIESEILGGLENEKNRLHDARRNLEFFLGDFSRYPVRAPGTSYDNARYTRTCLLMQFVVKKLTANLYRKGPARNLPDHPQAAEWLEACYRANTADALWMKADQLATVGDVATFQAVATTDPDKPVELYLWDASQVVVWPEEDEPLKPIAVGVIDLYDARRRLRLWTADEMLTYRTEKLQAGQTAGGTAYRRAGPTESNPFGILPFAFVHFEHPTCEFWSGSPGSNLAEANDYANFFLTEQSDCLRYNTRPVIVAKNVKAGWRPPSPIKPGDWWDIPSSADAAGEGVETDVSYLQADTGFMGAGWEDLQQYIDLCLCLIGVPPGTVRIVPNAAKSGIAIVVEHIPLILWAEGRQRLFAKAEDELLKVVATVGSKHLGANEGYEATAAQLEAAAADPGLVLKWPSMYPDLPGPERDQGDQWELEMGLTSRIELLMKRRNLTREEAEDALEQIAEDRALEQKLLAPELVGASAKPGEKPDDEPLDEDAEETNEPEEEDDNG
jgi:hypothetical protein